MHVLQPKHTKISTEEAQFILSKYNINKFQLPKIKKSDKALPNGVNIGDIIKIERKSEGNKKVIYYRVVI